MYIRLLIILWASHCVAYAQPAYFEYIFGQEDAGNNAISAQQLPEGSIFLAGNSNAGTVGQSDMTLSKFTQNGTLLWTKYYGTSDIEYANDMLITADNRIFIAGFTAPTDNDKNGFIVEIDTLGDEIQHFVSPFSTVVEVFEGIAEMPDGGLVAAGFKTGIDTLGWGNDAYLVRFDAAGNVLWENTYGGLSNDVAYNAVVDAASNIAFSGDTQSYHPTEADNIDVLCAKVDSNGTLIWELPIGDIWANGNKNIMIAQNGDYVLVGESVVDFSYKFDLTLSRITPNGQLLWHKKWGDNGTDAGFGIQEDSEGNFLIVGYSNGRSPNAPIDMLYLKTDAAGNEIAHTLFGNTSIDIAYSIQPAVFANSYLIAGFQTINGKSQYYLRYAADIATEAVATPAIFIEKKTLFQYESSSNSMYCSSPTPQNWYLQIYTLHGRLLWEQRPVFLDSGQQAILLPEKIKAQKGILIFRAKALKSSIFTHTLKFLAFE